MVKTEWGTKRECGGCGTRFYDLGHDPIVCPKCEEVFTPEAAKLTRAEVRAKAKSDAEEKSKAEEALAAKKAADIVDEEAALLEAAGITDGDSDDDDDDDAGLIEGGFDIEDEDDVSDVVVAPVANKTDDV